MKPGASAAGNRRRRAALAVGALLAGGVALAIVAWKEPVASQPPVQSIEIGTRANPAAMTQVQLQAPTAALAPTRPSASPAQGNETDPAADLTRLRTRGLALPLRGLSAAQLSDNYTQTRAAGAAHEALDILAPRGTPVVAIDDGRIAKLFLSKAGGITLYQFDPDGEFAYYYAHLDRYADGIVEGDYLRKGQLLGFVGSTGNARPDAPHLHLAVVRLGPERQWWRGTPINPFLIWRDAKP